MRTPVFVRFYRLPGFSWTVCVYGDPMRNPLLAIQVGKIGTLVQTRGRSWQSPKLRRWMRRTR